MDQQVTTRRRGVSPKGWFLLGTIAFFAVYLQMAFGLEWRTQAGRIGPGYFPRIIGVLAIVLSMLAFAQDLRSDVHEVVDLEDEVGDAAEHLGRHPALMAIFVLLCAGFITLLPLIGAIVSTALFLGVTLLLLDRENRVRSVVLAVAIPVLLYAIFDIALNAGLPSGPVEALLP